MGELARRANEADVELAGLGVLPADVFEVSNAIGRGELSDALGRQVFEGVIAGEGRATEVIAARGLAVVRDTGALQSAVDAAIAANAEVAQKVRDGKVNAVGVIVGAVMKSTGGQADAATVRQLVLASLNVTE
jgi:aspartyl-tRNA(Asn)/glutamyl-tRNA(Gln) amidotransferase subunit B